MIIKVDITNEQRTRAKELYDFNVLPSSFTRGKGNIIGALGEIVVKDTWSNKLRFPDAPSYDYDLITSTGAKVDVKSKRISNYKIDGRFTNKVSVSTSGKGITQDCDWYVFCYVSDNLFDAWILGWCTKKSFLRNSVFKRKGDIDDIGTVLNTRWRFPVDTYVMVADDLIYVEPS